MKRKKLLGCLFITALIMGCGDKNSATNQPQKSSNNEANQRYYKNLADKLDKQEALRCIAAAQVGYIRSKNAELTQAQNYFTKAIVLWTGMLKDSGYLNGDLKEIQKATLPIIDITDITFSNSGISILVEDCLNKIDVNKFTS